MPHVNKQMISFFLTSKCNLRCVYCYNSKERAQFEEKTLSFDIAKAGIDYFFPITIADIFVSMDQENQPKHFHCYVK